LDQLYSVTLLMSLAGGVAALAGVLAGRVRAALAPASARLVVPAAAGAWLALFVSFTVHLRWGHPPGSPQALPGLEFLRGHPSFVIAAIIPGIALIVRPRDAKKSAAR
jgi:hypothetical protein